MLCAGAYYWTLLNKALIFQKFTEKSDKKSIHITVSDLDQSIQVNELSIQKFETDVLNDSTVTDSKNLS